MTDTFFHHVKLDIADLDRSLAFYCGMLGWRVIVRYDRDDGVSIVQVSPTGEPPGVELWHEAPKQGFAHDRLHFALGVADVEATFERLVALGATIVRPPFAIGREMIAFIRDPDGYLIELNSLCS